MLHLSLFQSLRLDGPQIQLANLPTLEPMICEPMDLVLPQARQVLQQPIELQILQRPVTVRVLEVVHERAEPRERLVAATTAYIRVYITMFDAIH